jgi:sugar/nucleoside kinase (ribokinase family)
MSQMGLRGVLCSGSIVQDTLVRPAGESAWGTTTFVETIQPHIGGNGANTSLAVAECGVPVRLLGTVGSDEAGRAAVETLCRRGVDTRFVGTTSNAPTAATIVMVNAAGDRKFYHQVGASAHAFTSPVDFAPEIVDGMSHYHLASLFILPRMRAHAPECLARAKAAGLTTSLDTNWDPQGLWLKDIGPCLPHLDFIFVNEDEARMLTGCSAHSTAASHLLAGGARTAVMKLGPRGCAIYTSDEEVLCPAFDVDVKDTTGAGDCFAGAFLAALARRDSLVDAGMFANAMGAITVQHVGGVAGLHPYPDVEQWMQTAGLRG